MRSAPPPGVLGAVIGATAIGTMAATSTLTTTIILIKTTILTATSAAKAATGSTTRSTEATLLMGTGKRRINSAVRVRVELVELVVQVAPVALAVRVVLVGLADRVASVALAVRVALAELANPVAWAELAVRVALELVPAVAKLALGPAAVVPVPNQAAGLELVPAEVALGLVPVAAAAGLDQLGARRRTRSATAAHHHGQVPVPRVEDLRAAAETTREPAATEAAVAWEAAE